MSSLQSASSPFRDQPVPMLDVERQNGPLRAEILEAIAQVCDSGRFVFGPDCQALEQSLAAYCGAKHAIGCASGSDALLLALMALEIGAGDEVILPSFTFFATAGAVWRLGAKPVFVDIEPETMNLDPALIEQHITPATKAILPVHLFGLCADMTAINAIAAKHNLPVIEDAAQSVGAEHRGVRAGNLGLLGCFSFYPTKNLGGFGDGGMLTTNDARLAERLRILRDHGQSPRYYHSLVGLNSRLDSIQAAVLNIKLRELDRWAALRAEHADAYLAAFTAAGLDQVIRLPKNTTGDRHVWNQFTIRIPDGQRDALQKHLTEHKIGSAIYYPVPLHRQECFAALGYQEGSLPVTEQAAREVLSLPVFPELTADERQTVIGRLSEFFAPQTSKKPPVAMPKFLSPSTLPSNPTTAH